MLQIHHGSRALISSSLYHLRRSIRRPPTLQYPRHVSNSFRTQSAADAGPRKRKIDNQGLTIGRAALLVIGVFISSHIFLTHAYSMSAAYGISMLPTLNSFGDVLVTNKMYRRGRGVVIGDVICVKHPVMAEERAVKRVIGMPGDFVMEGTPDTPNQRMIQIPEGHCWIVGDNMAQSRDSRIYGPLPLGLVVGKIVWKIETRDDWPWKWKLRRVTNAFDID